MNARPSYKPAPRLLPESKKHLYKLRCQGRKLAGIFLPFATPGLVVSYHTYCKPEQPIPRIAPSPGDSELGARSLQKRKADWGVSIASFHSERAMRNIFTATVDLGVREKEM